MRSGFYCIAHAGAFFEADLVRTTITAAVTDAAEMIVASVLRAGNADTGGLLRANRTNK